VKTKIYKTMILLFVLYGCENWSLTIERGYRLRLSEKRALRKIFQPNSNEVNEAAEAYVTRSPISFTFRLVFTFYCIMYVLFYVCVLLYCVVYVLLYCI
jgi:hypothetical protein